MFSIFDKYILKRYLGTFILMLMLFIPIGITVNLAEKIDKMNITWVDTAYSKAYLRHLFTVNEILSISFSYRQSKGQTLIP